MMGYLSDCTHLTLRKIATLLHLMPPRPTDDRILFPITAYSIEVQTWSSQVNYDYPDASKCYLTQVTFRKCSTEKQHEVLTVKVEHPTHGITHLVAHRIPGAGATDTQSPVKVTGSTQSSFPVPMKVNAADQVLISGELGTVGGTVGLFYSSSYDELEIMDFPSSLPPEHRPNLIQFATLLEAAHASNPVYDLKKTQCYWYAGVVWMSLIQQFPQGAVRETSNRKKSTYKGISIGSDLNIDLMMNKYNYLLALHTTELARREQVKAVERAQVCHQDILKCLLIDLMHQQDFERGIERGRRERDVEVERLEGEIDKGRRERDVEVERLEEEIQVLRRQLTEVKNTAIVRN